MKKKSATLVLAILLVLVAAVGGTFAWLTATTAPVVNTFTTSDIDITLTETPVTPAYEYKMVPGYTISKDPKVTVLAGSEKCYLFVKIDKSTNFDSFLTYSIATGWTQGDGTSIPSNVWYRTVDATSSDQLFEVLSGNALTVLSTVTKANMNALTADTLPKLTFTAYASQYNKDATTAFTAVEAWTVLNPTP